MFLNVTIDERGDVTGCGAGLVGGLRNGQLVQQVIKHFDGFLVLGLGVCRIRGYGVHDVDRGHRDGHRTEESVDGGFQRSSVCWRNFVQLKTNRVSHSESPRVSALYMWLSVYAKQNSLSRNRGNVYERSSKEGVEWMKRKRKSVAEAGHFEYFGRGIFLKLTSPKVVSETLLSQIRTRTRFSHRYTYFDRFLLLCAA